MRRFSSDSAETNAACGVIHYAGVVVWRLIERWGLGVLDIGGPAIARFRAAIKAAVSISAPATLLIQYAPRFICDSRQH